MICKNNNAKKGEKTKNVPEEYIKKITKNLFYTIGWMLCAVILIWIVIVAFSKVTGGDMLAKQEEEIALLEEYYAAGDYESMCNYLDKIDQRGGSYEKYNRIGRLYQGMESEIGALQSNMEYAESVELDVVSVEDDIERCMMKLAVIEEMENLEFPYSEKEGALYIKTQYVNALTEYALLTEEEIKSAVSVYCDEGENDYIELAEISIQRIEECFR